MKQKRVLSGVQPTGALHLGNWLGAIKNWVDLQHQHDTFFCVVDLHAITVPQDVKTLSENTLSTAAMYIACGIDPKKSSIFIQSHISAHCELCWILNCLTPINWMERMIQFKEKALKQGDNVSIGLFDYPVLMAADILLYQPDLVPVGEDQKQHLELARNIAQQRINSRFGKDKENLLKIPDALIMKQGAKVMSLNDGRNKMSKSDPNANSRITLLDPPDLILKKIKKAKTDQFIGLEFNNPDRPEADNLLNIYSILSNKSKEASYEECKEMGWGMFKPLLAELVIDSLKPIQSQYKELMDDKEGLGNIIKSGNEKANEISSLTLQKIKDAIGLINKL